MLNQKPFVNVPYLLIHLFILISCTVSNRPSSIDPLSTVITTSNTLKPESVDLQLNIEKGTDTPTTQITQQTPVLTSTQDLSGFLKIYQTNGGCMPPCIWGIVPGITTAEELYSTLSPFGTIEGRLLEDGKIIRHDFSIDAPLNYDRQGFGYISAVFFTKQNIVQKIQLALVNVSPNYYPEIHDVLATFGQPTSMFVAVFPESGGLDPGHYLLVLHYSETGITLRFMDNLYIYHSKKFLCPQFSENPIGPRPFLYTWDTSDQIDLGEIIPEFENYVPMSDEFPGYTSSAFYSDYSNPTIEDCLETKYLINQ